MKKAAQIRLSNSEREVLHRWSSGAGVSPGVAAHARIVLFAAAGLTGREIATKERTSRKAVSRCLRHFERERLAGVALHAHRGPGRAPKQETIVPRIAALLVSPGPGGGSWTVSALSRVTGCSRQTVRRALDHHGIRLRELRSAGGGAGGKGGDRPVPMAKRLARDLVGVGNPSQSMPWLPNFPDAREIPRIGYPQIGHANSFRPFPGIDLPYG